ncbi:TolC family protein [Candidatus Dependentiae bacterium]|nr:TolC family protein [Candidatus Dependentiae bacterium]
MFFILIFSPAPNAEEINMGRIFSLTSQKKTLNNIYQLSLEIEKAKYLQIRSNYYPHLKLEHLSSERGGDYEFEPVVSYRGFEVPIDINIFRKYETKLTLGQLLYDNNRIKQALQIEKSEILIRKEEVRKIFLDELAVNLNLYFGILATKRKINLMEENLELINKIVSISEVQLANGMITEIDLKIINNKRREQELFIRAENRNLKTLKQILAERLDISSVSIQGDNTPLIQIKEQTFYLEKLIISNPDIQIQELRILQSNANVKRNIAEKGPVISFFYTYALRSDELLSTNGAWIAGVNLSQDIFSGSLKKQRIIQAKKEKLLQEEIQKELKEKQKVLLLEKFRKTEEVFERFSIKEELVEIYSEKVQIEQSKLEAGKISQLDFLKTSTEYTSYKIELELLKIEFLKNYFELLYITGLLDSYFGS